MSKIIYPAYIKNGDDDGFYHICLKYLCKDFAKRHEIHKIGTMIEQRGAMEAMHMCLKNLETLVEKELKKTNLAEKEQKEVVQHVNTTVVETWKGIGN